MIRKILLNLLTPEKIKIYLIILICLCIYIAYYRIQKNEKDDRNEKDDGNENIIESFHDKNFKSNPRKQNYIGNDETYNNDVSKELLEPKEGIDTPNIIEKFLDIDPVPLTQNNQQKALYSRSSIKDPDPVNKYTIRTLNDDAYDYSIKKTFEELAIAEDSKLRNYNNALNTYLEQKRNNSLNVNLLNVGNVIENGLIDIFQSASSIPYSKTKTQPFNTTKSSKYNNSPAYSNEKRNYYNYNYKNKDKMESKNTRKTNKLIEGFSNNSDPEEEEIRNVLNARDTIMFKNINKEIQNADEIALDETISKTLNQRLSSYGMNNTERRTKENNKMDKDNQNVIMYVLGYINNFIYNFDKERFLGYFENYNEFIKIIMRDENILPAGILLIIISMGLYFIDISS